MKSWGRSVHYENVEYLRISKSNLRHFTVGVKKMWALLIWLWHVNSPLPIRFFTITAEIHTRSLANFYCQYADRRVNLKFMWRVSKRELAIQQFVIIKNKLMSVFNVSVGGAVASWLVRSTPEWAVQVWALAGDIVLCSWARYFTLTVPLSTQVYKWVPANLMLGGNPAMD